MAIALSFFCSIAKSMGSSAASETVRGERCDASTLSFLMLERYCPLIAPRDMIVEFGPSRCSTVEYDLDIQIWIG